MRVIVIDLWPVPLLYTERGLWHGTWFMGRPSAVGLRMCTYLNVAEHGDEVVRLAAQGKVVEDVLVHELDVRVP